MFFDIFFILLADTPNKKKRVSHKHNLNLKNWTIYNFNQNNKSLLIISIIFKHTYIEF